VFLEDGQTAAVDPGGEVGQESSGPLGNVSFQEDGPARMEVEQPGLGGAAHGVMERALRDGQALHQLADGRQGLAALPLAVGQQAEEPLEDAVGTSLPGHNCLLPAALPPWGGTACSALL
jgi:hypothetical protein